MHTCAYSQEPVPFEEMTALLKTGIVAQKPGGGRGRINRRVIGGAGAAKRAAVGREAYGPGGGSLRTSQ